MISRLFRRQQSSRRRRVPALAHVQAARAALEALETRSLYSTTAFSADYVEMTSTGNGNWDQPVGPGYYYSNTTMSLTITDLPEHSFIEIGVNLFASLGKYGSGTDKFTLTMGDGTDDEKDIVEIPDYGPDYDPSVGDGYEYMRTGGFGLSVFGFHDSGSITVTLKSDGLDPDQGEVIAVQSAGATTWNPKISASDTLWWFNVDTPVEDYSTGLLVGISDLPPRTKTADWIDNAEGTLKLVNDQTGEESTYMLTRTPPHGITIESIGKSMAENDSPITLKLDGHEVDTKNFTVRAPDSIQYLPNQPVVSNYDVNGAQGYSDVFHFKILDQFGDVLPNPVPFNEDFGAWQNDVPNVWVPAAPNGVVVNPADAADQYARSFSSSANPPSPATTHPGTTGTRVQHVTQYYYVGSTEIGKGILVDTHTLNFYTDHADVG